MASGLIARLRSNFHPRQRLSTWGLRLVLGAVLLTFSEAVMWQNPVAHSAADWLARAILYVCIGAILLDVTVRFQARDIAGLALVGGLYGLLNGGLIGRDVYTNFPWNLLLRGMGLQTGAGIYGLLFFILVIQGRQVDWRAILGAVVVGALWGIWLKWYPIQTVTSWGAVSLETGITVFLVCAGVTGLLFLLFAPGFSVIKEDSLLLEWWEAILVGIPPFIALISGLLDEALIPAALFALVVVIIAVIIGALNLNRHGSDPSFLANITIAVPNPATFLILVAVFLTTGALAATITTDADSPLGIATYWIIIAAGALWLPAASVLVGIRAYRAEV